MSGLSPRRGGASRAPGAPLRSAGRPGHLGRGPAVSRSEGVYLGRATCRLNTVSWCRRMAISTSFASGVGPIPSSPSTRRSSTKLTLPITPDHHATSASALVSGLTHHLHPSG